MTIARTLKWITGAFEAVLGIPILGGLIVLGFSWTPLFVMLILHIVTLVFTKVEKDGPAVGSILGIITSCVGWIPILGMIMHILTAVCLMVTAAIPSRDDDPNTIIM